MALSKLAASHHLLPLVHCPAVFVNALRVGRHDLQVGRASRVGLVHQLMVWNSVGHGEQIHSVVVRRG